MKVLALSSFLVCASAVVFADTDRNQAASENVNSRYTVESVVVADQDKQKLSKQLKEDLEKLVGAKFEQAIVDNLARRIRKELHAASVMPKVSRGRKPST